MADYEFDLGYEDEPIDLGFEQEPSVAADVDLEPMSMILGNLTGGAGGSVLDFASQAAALREAERQRRQEAADILAQTKTNDYGPDAKSLFGQALAAFLPALVGRAVGGNDLAAAGAKMGMEFSDRRSQQYKQDAKEAKATDLERAKQAEVLAGQLGRQADLLDRDALFQQGRQADREATKEYREKQLALGEERNRIAASKGGPKERGPTTADVRIADRLTEMDKYSIPGTSQIKPPTPYNHQAATKILSSADNVDSLFGQLEDAVRSNDRDAINRISNALTLDLATLKERGANFTESEQLMIRSQIPAWNDFTFRNVGELARRNALGEDPVAAIRASRLLYREAANRTASINGYVPTGWKPSAQTLEVFNRSGFPLSLSPEGLTLPTSAVADAIRRRYSGISQQAQTTPAVDPRLLAIEELRRMREGK